MEAELVLPGQLIWLLTLAIFAGGKEIQLEKQGHFGKLASLFRNLSSVKEFHESFFRVFLLSFPGGLKV